MNSEEALALIESLLEGQKLKDIQKQVFHYSWQGLTYPEIAEQTKYDTSYIRDVGSELWQHLSQVLGERVTKNTLQSVLRRQTWKRSPFPTVTTVENQQSQISEAIIPANVQFKNCWYWREAIDVSVFYGRDRELAQLTQWIVTDRCRLIALLGIGGIGKTTLAAKLGQTLAGSEHREKGNGEVKSPNNTQQFEFIIWQSLRNAPPLQEVLAKLISILSDRQETILPASEETQISQLINYLRSSRCLLVLDNFDAILSSSTAGYYREGYEAYNELLRRVGLEQHLSCLVLTSREKPKTLTPLEGKILPVRSLQLKGLSTSEAQAILKTGGCFAQSQAEWNHLTTLYCGNPLALKIVSTTVQDLFDGSITKFLEQGAIVFGDINTLLDEQFQRLSELEKHLMYWLAIHQEWVSLADLQDDFIHLPSQSKLLEALQSLERRSLLEKSSGHFTLQPVVMEYVTEQFIQAICVEISTKELALFISHALIQAQVKDYIRESQIRLILQPLSTCLLNKFRSKKNLIEHLNQVLLKLRVEYSASTGYGGGNLLNLCQHLQIDLTGYDFSSLTIRQAYLQSAILNQVNFADAEMVQCVFMQTFGGIMAIAFSPDGQLLVTGDSTGKVWLWRVADGQPLWTYFGHTQCVRSVAFSPDGVTIASCCLDETIKLWDAQTGQLLKTLQGHIGAVRAVAFSPDGTMIVSGGLDRTIRFWDVQTGQLLKVLHGHSNMVKSVAFSPDGTKIASGCFDYTVKLWDVYTETLLKTLDGHDNVVLTVTWSPDGRTIASCGGDHTIKLWDANTGELLKTLRGHTHWTISVQFSPDNQLLVSSSDDRTVRLWDVKTGKLLRTMQGHRYWVHGVAFNADGTIIASGSDDQTVKFWDARTGDLLNTLQGYTNSVLSVAWSPDGQMLASSSTDYTVSLWDVDAGQRSRILQGHTHWVWSIAFSPDGTLLASGSDDQTAKLWKVQTGSLVRTLEGHTHWALSIVFSPDGKTIATGSIDRNVRLWDVETGQLLKTLEGHTNMVWSVAFSHNGQLLASGGDDRTVRLWDVRTGEVLKILAHSNSVFSVKFSLDDLAIATGGADSQIRLWHLDTGQVLRTFQGHTNQILSVAYSPDGKLLASGSADHTVRVWDAYTGELLHTCIGHTYWVHSVAFSPDGQRLASGSGDGTIKLWKSTGEYVSTWQPARPYEGMNIKEVKGLTEAQKATLKALGAIEH
ncbi:NACHT domain-containing protein [Aerosakkonemataceae cyanobacterium BLCC-F50]|uniref:NACHT domain-containing protein n=1 Tax=Floridaenema flaviceps BLCC-F50 TaxID=3153642 RepID=A0ABV4Y468_9CYAN